MLRDALSIRLRSSVDAFVIFLFLRPIQYCWPGKTSQNFHADSFIRHMTEFQSAKIKGRDRKVIWTSTTTAICRNDPQRYFSGKSSLKFQLPLRCICIHCVSKKVHLFIFMITRSSVGPILMIFGSIVGEKIWSLMTFLSYNIQFVYEYYRIEKRERFCTAFNASASSCRRVNFLQLLKKFVSPAVPNLYLEIP